MADSPPRSVLLVEPWFRGSHRSWAEGYRRSSRHHVSLLTTDRGGWRATMQEAAPELATKVNEVPDAVVASSMLDLAAFKRLSSLVSVPVVLYMHENQLTYVRDRPDSVFGLINWQAVEVADAVAFNSRFHLEDFYTAAPLLDVEPGAVRAARDRSVVLPVGLDPAEVGERLRPSTELTIVWNHRWEADKDPAAFVDALQPLSRLRLRLILLGEHDPGNRHVQALEDRFGERILHAGFADKDQYRRLLARADVVVSTARQEFFGVAVAEAMAAGVVPVVPDRLNYPDLIPDHLHSVCLYEEGGLSERLAYFAAHPGQLDSLRAPVIAAVAPYAWDVVASRYDELVDSVTVRAT